MVRRLNVDGDGQGDLAGHGGEMRAVLVYQLQSYQYWQKQLGRDDLTFGIFGENFTVDGLADNEVCIGDRYRIGEAEFEVSQPRVTCYRVGMRLGEVSSSICDRPTKRVRSRLTSHVAVVNHTPDAHPRYPWRPSVRRHRNRAGPAFRTA